MKIQVYDTTLRDGSQMEGISFSVDDKIRIAQRLDAFGVDFIEGGWPGAVPKDTEFFERMADLPLRNARLCAFGSTRRAGSAVETDPFLAFLIGARTPVVTLVAKSSRWQVTDVLRTTPEENLRMIYDSVAYLKAQGKEVILDAEHFFDGWKLDSSYSADALSAAVEAGADVLVPCDTNGGTMPHVVESIIAQVVARFPDTVVGMHPHDDGDCGTANAIAAVRAGARHVQGTINGYGERTGNANLIPIVANLRLKMGYDCLSESALRDLTGLSAFVDEIANLAPNSRAAYVGRNAFTHKAGLHVDGIAKHAAAYEHIAPETVGNVRRLPVSEQSGTATIAQKAADLGYEFDKKSTVARSVLDEVTRREHEGYSFEGAEGSFELLVKQATGNYRPLFTLVGYRVLVEKRANDPEPITEATLRVRIGDREELVVAEGDGPVHALDGALRRALVGSYPELSDIELTDFKVRVVTAGEGTAARVRTIIESTDHHGSAWSTVGVSTNIIEASWRALVDAVEVGLLNRGYAPETTGADS